MGKNKNEQSEMDVTPGYEYIIVTESSRLQSDDRLTSPLSGDPLNATQLFSLFTADIIKQEVLFIR